MKNRYELEQRKKIRVAVRRPQGIVITIRAHLAKRSSGEEFSVVTVNLPKAVPVELWHSFRRRRQFLDEAHRFLRYLVYGTK